MRSEKDGRREAGRTERSAQIEEALQNGGGGDGVAPFFFLFVREAGAGHFGVGGGGGEAFVEELDGPAGAGGDAVGPGADELGALAFRAVHVDGEADDEAARGEGRGGWVGGFSP